MSKLEIIIGLKVLNAEFSKEGAGINFSNGISLFIYNKFSFIGSDFIGGELVEKIDENEKTISILFEKQKKLVIDMSDEAYSGPEALQLIVPDHPIVIWN